MRREKKGCVVVYIYSVFTKERLITFLEKSSSVVKHSKPEASTFTKCRVKACQPLQSVVSTFTKWR